MMHDNIMTRVKSILASKNLAIENEKIGGTIEEEINGFARHYGW